MTPEEHTSTAERFAASAEEWMDADYGWRAGMSTPERIARRSADLQAAQVHATLAQNAVAREYGEAVKVFMAAMTAESKPAEAATKAAVTGR